MWIAHQFVQKQKHTGHKIKPEMIRPHPKSKLVMTKKGRAKKRSEELTDTPVKTRIEQEAAERQEKKRQKEERRKMKELSNKNKKSASVNKKLKLSISSDEDDEDEWKEDPSGDELEMEELSEDDNPNIEPGDFALVKVSGKKNTYFYAAEIVNKTVDTHYEVKYFKRVQGTFKFVSGNEDVYIALESDIELKLPRPTTHGRTERTIQQLSFNVDLSNYSKNLK